MIDPPTVIDVFVSNRGSDKTGDGSLAKPFSSNAKAWGIIDQYRRIHPNDWIGLRNERGSILDPVGGHSHYSKIIISGYGRGARPRWVVPIGANSALFTFGADLRLYDIEPVPVGRDPAVKDFVIVGGGIGASFQQCQRVVIEDCDLHHFAMDAQILNCNGVRINRCIIRDAYGVHPEPTAATRPTTQPVIVPGPDGGEMGHGLYAEGTPDLEVDDTYLIHDGWNSDPRLWQSIPYNVVFTHAVYAVHNANPIVFNNCVVCRGSDGISDPGGVLTDLLAFDTGQNYDLFAQGPSVTIRHSAFMGTATCPAISWGGGISIQGQCAYLDDVIFAHQAKPQVNPGVRVAWPGHLDPTKDYAGVPPILHRDPGSLIILNNVRFYDWPNAPAVEVDVMRPAISLQGMTVSRAKRALSIPDPAIARYVIDGQNIPMARLSAWLFPPVAKPVPTLEDYAKAVGVGKTAEDLIAAMLQQDRYNWRDDLTAKAVNDWLRR